MISNKRQEKPLALAIDIGGTKIELAFIDIDGHLILPVEKHCVPFDANGVACAEDLLQIIVPYVDKAKTLPGEFFGVGLSLCGNIDRSTGMAVLVPNLHWRYLPFGQYLKDKTGALVFSATDVRMAAQAEIIWGAANGIRNFAWATVGTGYGGYFFLNGKFYEGTHGFAGNFGHTTWDEINGAVCGCGLQGCIETFVAGPAIARAGRRSAETGESPFLQDILKIREVTSRDVFEAEDAGDETAHQIIEQVVRLISINLASLVNTLDLEMIVLGGGVVHATLDFFDRIERKIRSYILTEEGLRDLKIVKESFSNSALFGAATEVFVQQGLLEL